MKNLIERLLFGLISAEITIFIAFITGYMIYFTIATFQAMFILKNVLSILCFIFTFSCSILLIKLTISVIIDTIRIFKGDF